MITLAKKIKEEKEKKEKGTCSSESLKTSRISVRDKLLTKGMLMNEYSLGYEFKLKLSTCSLRTQ